jgi:hypothetical protein
MAFAPLRESKVRPSMLEGGKGLNLKGWVELVLLYFVSLLPQGVGSSKIFRAPLYFGSLAQKGLSTFQARGPRLWVRGVRFLPLEDRVTTFGHYIKHRRRSKP